MDDIFELINNWKKENTKEVFSQIAKLTSKRLDYLSSICSKYKDLNVFDDIFWCGWWEFENISDITETHIEFYARHLYEGDYDKIIVPLRWFTITNVEFLNEIRTRKIKKIDNEISKLQNKIDDYHKIKSEIENIKF